MVGLRLWTRGVVIKQLGVDDCLCVIGLVSDCLRSCSRSSVLTSQLITYGVGVAITHMTKYGLGRHVYIMDPANVPLYLRVSRSGGVTRVCTVNLCQDFYVSIVMYWYVHPF